VTETPRLEQKRKTRNQLHIDPSYYEKIAKLPTHTKQGSKGNETVKVLAWEAESIYFNGYGGGKHYRLLPKMSVDRREVLKAKSIPTKRGPLR